MVDVTTGGMTEMVSIVGHVLAAVLVLVTFVFMWRIRRNLSYQRLDSETVEAAVLRSTLRLFRKLLWVVGILWVLQVVRVGLLLAERF